MKTCRLLRLIVINVLLLRQIVNATTQSKLMNILLMPYTQNPHKWQNNTTDFTSVILNEQLVQALNNLEPPQLNDIQAIYNEALSKMYDILPLQDLIELLWKTYEKYNVQSFITMSRAQLALYERYRLDHIHDTYYILLAAHGFYKIKNDAFFTRLHQTTQDLLDTNIKSLPSSLQYLFGKQQFCLYNDQHSEVMYQTTDHKIKGETSLVLSSSWHKINVTYLGRIEAKFEQTTENYLSDLSLALVSKHLGGYFHRLPEYDNKIAATDSKRHLRNFLWSVELVDHNQLAFRQEDYLLCRQEEGAVYALKEKTIYDAECQWSAEECHEPATLSIYSKKMY